MIKILCPTDFSSNSEFAVEYSVHLANAIGATLTLVTSYKVPVYVGSPVSWGARIREFLESDLTEFAAKFKPLITTGYEPETAVVQGNTSVSILEYARKSGTDLIIMGTTGSSSLEKVIFGSITRKFFETSDIPVLAIPSTSRGYGNSNKIVLALDSGGISNEHSIKILKQLKKLPSASLDVIHVTTTSDEDINLKPNTGKLAGIVDNIADVEGSDTVYEIKKYADDNNAGILAMVGRKHSVWDKLFFERKSVSELTLSDIPVLFLPENND